MAFEFLCNRCTTEGRKIEILICFEVLQGLLQVLVHLWLG